MLRRADAALTPPSSCCRAADARAATRHACYAPSGGAAVAAMLRVSQMPPRRIACAARCHASRRRCFSMPPCRERAAQPLFPAAILLSLIMIAAATAMPYRLPPFDRRRAAFASDADAAYDVYARLPRRRLLPPPPDAASPRYYLRFSLRSIPSMNSVSRAADETPLLLMPCCQRLLLRDTGASRFSSAERACRCCRHYRYARRRATIDAPDTTSHADDAGFINNMRKRAEARRCRERVESEKRGR